MLIVGCLFIGIALGMWADNAGAGAILGLGVGFVLQYLFGEDGQFVRRSRSGGKNTEKKSE